MEEPSSMLGPPRDPGARRSAEERLCGVGGRSWCAPESDTLLCGRDLVTTRSPSCSFDAGAELSIERTLPINGCDPSPDPARGGGNDPSVVA